MSGDCGHGWSYHNDGPSGPCSKCQQEEAMNTNRDVAYKPGIRNGRKGAWNKSNFGSGLCFTLGYDDLERVLKNVRRLKETEQIERVEINASGITVFIEPMEEPAPVTKKRKG